MSGRCSLLGTLLLMLCVAGCVTHTRNEFTAFAQAGSGYMAAVDKLLVAAGAAQVDSTSWMLILDKRTTGLNDETYEAKSREDAARLQVLERLRQQARLLARYFGLLEALATSGAPDRTKTAIAGVVAGLDKLKAELPAAASALPDLGKVMIDFRLRAALRGELRARETIIREHLAIQEQLLKELAGQIGSALARTRDFEEQTLVIAPLVSGEPLPSNESLVSTRRRIFMTSLMTEELVAASEAATKLREVFDGLITGEVTLGRINALLTDIESLFSITETIRSPGAA